MKIFFLTFLATIECLNINLPSGRFTLKISYSTVNNFYLKYGNLIFNFTQNRILLNKKNFSIRKLKDFSFMAQSHIWLSASLINPHHIQDNFIKIGHDFVLLNNTLYDFRPNDLATLKIIRSVSSIEIDPFIELTNYTVHTSALIKDPSFKIYSQYRQNIDALEAPTSKYSLPSQLKVIYEMIKKRGFKLKQLELDAIKFSHEMPGCFLNHESSVSVSVDAKNVNHYPFVIEIHAKSSPIQDNANLYGIYKILDGTMQVDFYNSINDSNIVKTKILHTDEMAWFSPDLYKIFQIKNIHSSKPLVIAKILANYEPKFESADTIEYTIFKQIVLREFLSQSCDTQKSDCCDTSGPVCGWKLREKNCSNNLHPNGLYFCDGKLKSATLAQNCDDHCHQEKNDGACVQKFRARSLMADSELNFVQETDSIWLYGLISGVQKNSLFVIKFYSENNCSYVKNSSVIFPLVQLENLPVTSDTSGSVVVNVKVKGSIINLNESKDRSILDRIVVLEDMNGSVAKCGIVESLNSNVSSEKLDEIKYVTMREENQKVMYALWEDRKARRKFISYDDGLEWTEYYNGKVFGKFRFVQFANDGVIIYEDRRGFYAKITDSDLKWGSSISNISWKFGTGYWILKPVTKKLVV
ncbi:hypothetical protein BpHYR1_040450 [Brachionus plicatilis]|uniref:Uncharacterized protein n=1 Tax=Brachionus plicatilis TaxID=10195 RepID=A0A3M7S8J0_BRAPC|nr:hypothetical protein BpHYR1_040450 [Brachionus plicatilis]